MAVRFHAVSMISWNLPMVTVTDRQTLVLNVTIVADNANLG